jgi:hypothetical protein
VGSSYTLLYSSHAQRCTQDHDTIETALRMASDGKPLGKCGRLVILSVLVSIVDVSRGNQLPFPCAVRVPMDFKMFKELCTDVPRITRESVVRSLLADAGVGLQ